ncbi:hypothetical protein ES703_84763 [subsurface metagenome]
MLLFFAPVAEDALLSQAIHPDDRPGYHGGAAELLDNQNVADISGTPSPIFRGIGQPEVSNAAHLPGQLEWEFAFAIDLHRQWPYRPLGKITGCALDHFFVLTKFEIHFFAFFALSHYVEVGLH